MCKGGFICCNCWGCCIDLRAKVPIDDESIYNILFLVNKDANRRKEELSHQIDELKGLLERPAVVSQPSIVNNDNRQILNSVNINRVTKNTSNHVAVNNQIEQQVIQNSLENSSTPFADRFMRLSQSQTPSKTPSFSNDFAPSTGKKKQFALSRSSSERNLSKSFAQDMSLIINADAREFLILRLLDEQKYEDALEKSVQLVDMRKLILQDVRAKPTMEKNPDTNDSNSITAELAEIQLNRAVLLLAKCWKLLRRPEYAIKLLEEVLIRQLSCLTINFEGVIDTLKLMVYIYDDLKQSDLAVTLLKTTIHQLKEKHDAAVVGKGDEPMVGIAQVIHVSAEYFADIAELIDEAIEAYLEEISIYERMSITIDWRTLYRLGQLLARRGNHDRAIQYFDMAIELILKQHGDNFNPLGDVYHSKSLSLWQKEELHAAINILRKALPIKLYHFENEQDEESTTSDNAVTIAMINHALGEITEELGHAYDAIPFFEKAMEYYTLGYGTREHMSVAQTLHGLGDLLLQLGVKKEALACFEQSYQLYSLFRGKYHVLNMDVLSGKAAVLRLMGRFQDAMYVLQCIYEVFSYEFGEQDSRAIEVQSALDMIRQDMQAPPSSHSAPDTTTNSFDETFSFSSSVAAAIVSGVAPTPEQFGRSLASSFEEINQATSTSASITQEVGSPNGHEVVISPLFASPAHPGRQVANSSPRRAIKAASSINLKNNTSSSIPMSTLTSSSANLKLAPTSGVVTKQPEVGNRPITPPLEIQRK